MCEHYVAQSFVRNGEGRVTTKYIELPSPYTANLLRSEYRYKRLERVRARRPDGTVVCVYGDGSLELRDPNHPNDKRFPPFEKSRYVMVRMDNRNRPRYRLDLICQKPECLVSFQTTISVQTVATILFQL